MIFPDGFSFLFSDSFISGDWLKHRAVAFATGDGRVPGGWLTHDLAMILSL